MSMEQRTPTLITFYRKRTKATTHTDDILSGAARTKKKSNLVSTVSNGW